VKTDPALALAGAYAQLEKRERPAGLNVEARFENLDAWLLHFDA